MTIWSGWFLLLSWYPEICHECFANLVYFTRNLAHLKNEFYLDLPGTGATYMILKKGNTSNCLTVLLLEVNLTVCWLCKLSDFPEPKDSNFPDTVSWKRNTSWSLSNLSSISCCEFLNFWSHLSLKFSHMSFINATLSAIRGNNLNWRDTLCPTKICEQSSWLFKTNKNILTRPAMLLEEECGFLSWTAAGNQVECLA